jgi:hypothetical protein
MRRTLIVLAALAVGFAPAPLPKPEKRSAPPTLAGTWAVDWGGTPVRLALRRDGSARFDYVDGPSGWDGSWKYDGARRVTLTLMLDRPPYDFVLEFSALGRDRAEGKICDTPSQSRPLKLTRSGRE